MSNTLAMTGEAEAVNAALADPPPYIAPAPDLRVELIRGLPDPITGEWHTTAIVREMTGADEEALASLDAGNPSYGQYMSTLLARTVETIGPIQVTEEVIDRLIIGDRDLLFLGVVKATYGTTKEFQVRCRKCQETNDVTIHLEDDFPVRQVDYNVQRPIPVQLRRGGQVMVRMPNGEDSKIVADQTKNQAEQNTMLISRCVIWDGNAPADPLEWAKSLSTADRQAIVKVVLNQPGPEMEEVKAPCANCGDEMTLILDWASLLLA